MADYTGKSIEELNKLLEEKIEENRDLEDMKDDPEIAELISENNTEIDKINQILVMDEKPEGVSDTAVQEQEETEVSDEDDDLDDIIDDVKSRDEVSEDLYKEDEIVEEEKEVKVEDLPQETEPASQISDETFDFSSIVKGMDFAKGGELTWEDKSDEAKISSIKRKIDSLYYQKSLAYSEKAREVKKIWNQRGNYEDKQRDLKREDAYYAKSYKEYNDEIKKLKKELIDKYDYYYAEGGELHGEVSLEDLDSDRVKSLMKKHNVKITSREEIERAGGGFGQHSDIDYISLSGNEKDLIIVGRELDLVDEEGNAYAKGGKIKELEEAIRNDYNYYDDDELDEVYEYLFKKQPSSELTHDKLIDELVEKEIENIQEYGYSEEEIENKIKTLKEQSDTGLGYAKGGDLPYGLPVEVIQMNMRELNNEYNKQKDKNSPYAKKLKSLYNKRNEEFETREYFEGYNIPYEKGGKITKDKYRVGDILIAEWNWAQRPQPKYEIVEILGKGYNGYYDIKVKSLQDNKVFKSNEIRYSKAQFQKGGETDDLDIYLNEDFNSYTVVIDDDVYEMNESDMPNMSVDTYLGDRSRFPSDVSHWGRRLDYENLPMTIKVKIEKRKKHKYDNGGVVPNVYEVELIENVEKDPKREFFVVNENTYNEIKKLQHAGGYKRFEIDLYEDDSKKEMSNINDLERYVNSIGINPELEFAEGGVIQDMIDGFQDLLTGITDEDAEIHKQIDYLKRML